MFQRTSTLVLMTLIIGASIIPADPGKTDQTDLSAEKRLRKDLAYLASPDREGRGPRTKGIVDAGDYIAKSFQASGLAPAGANGGFFQEFTIPGASQISPGILSIKKGSDKSVELKDGTDFSVSGLSGSGKVKGQVVFLGYGIKRTGVDKQKDYDDRMGLDLEGKVVLILRDAPRPDGKAESFAPSAARKALASLGEKFNLLRNAKAAAILLVNDTDSAGKDDPLIPFDFFAFSQGKGAELPLLHVKRAVADAWLKVGTGHGLKEREDKINSTFAPDSCIIPNMTATVETETKRGPGNVKLRNVAGTIPGSGDLANETIVLGAHYDHVGYGGFSSMAQVKVPTIHPGADDNGSGTTGLLELARRMAIARKESPDKPCRRFVFVAFSGEELGLYGSVHYCKEPLFPLDKTRAMLNIDMIGKLRPDKMNGKDRVLIQGTGTAKEFDNLLDQWNANSSFSFQKQKSGFGPSDHNSFCAKKIPVLFFWTDVHEDYHSPSDTPDRIDYKGMLKVVGIVEKAAREVSTSRAPMAFIEVAPAPRSRSGGSGPRLGIQPGYASDLPGVLVERVLPGETGATAGLKDGDRIVELASKPVKDLEDYMSIMAAQKKGGTLAITVLRGKQKLTLQAKLD